MSVLAISLTVIFQLFSGGLKSSRLSQEYDRGIFHAREKMEEVLLSEELTEGVFEGKFEDAFGWKTQILLVEPTEGEEITLPFDTFRITVEVSWGEEGSARNFEISTTKIKKKLRK